MVQGGSTAARVRTGADCCARPAAARHPARGDRVRGAAPAHARRRQPPANTAGLRRLGAVVGGAHVRAGRAAAGSRAGGRRGARARRARRPAGPAGGAIGAAPRPRPEARPDRPCRRRSGQRCPDQRRPHGSARRQPLHRGERPRSPARLGRSSCLASIRRHAAAASVRGRAHRPLARAAPRRLSGALHKPCAAHRAAGVVLPRLPARRAGPRADVGCPRAPARTVGGARRSVPAWLEIFDGIAAGTITLGEA